MFNDYQFQTYAFSDYQWPAVTAVVVDDIAMGSGVFSGKSYVSGAKCWSTFVSTPAKSERTASVVGSGGTGG